MQLEANTREAMVHRASRENGKGNVMAAVESITIVSLGKWLIGAILAPWLWYERKRLDALTKRFDICSSEWKEGHFTKEETKEQIGLRLEPVHQKLDMIYNEVVKLREN